MNTAVLVGCSCSSSAHARRVPVLVECSCSLGARARPRARADGRDGAEAPDNYTPEGDIKRSPSGKAFEKCILTKLISLEPDPEVSSAFGELVAWAEVDFDSKAVRSDPAVFAKLCEAVAGVGKLTSRTTRHYQCWRRAFAVFQSKQFNKHGTLASPERQEYLRGVNSDAVLDYIKHTTEHFVQAQIDGEAPPVLKCMPPYKSALSVQQDILLLFWRDFAMGVAWITTKEVEDLMTDIQPSPLAAVPKKNPATLLFTGDWRIIHDHNKGGSGPINDRTERPTGKRHPPTVCPQHHEVALLIVWMTVVLPRLRIAAGKLDTFMAFINRRIHLMDVNFFATQFPGDAVGALRLTVVWGALTFGWTQSPSESGVSGWAVSQAHRRSGPSADDLLSMPDAPHLNSTFVVDGVIIDFVDVDARAFSSTEWFLVST